MSDRSSQSQMEAQLEISDHPLDLTPHGFDLGIRFGILAGAAVISLQMNKNRKRWTFQIAHNWI